MEVVRERRRVATRLAAIALGAVWLAGAGPAEAAGIPWSEHQEEHVIQIVTHDEDGAERTTKIWLVVVDGQGYIRTGGTHWGKNAKRDPDVRILTADGDYDVRVEFVTDPATRAAVTQAFRDKYGWSDRILTPFRGSEPLLMRLLPRSPAE